MNFRKMNIKKIKTYLKKVGVNKIQIISAVCVILVLTLFASVLFKKQVDTERNPKFEIAATELLALSGNIRNFYRIKPDYWGLDKASAIDNKIVPESMVKEDRIVNILNSDVEIGQGIDGTLTMPGTRSFDITYKNLDFASCVGLASFAFSQEESLGLLSLTIISGDKSHELSWGKEQGLPLALGVAKKFCNEVNNIVWKYE